MNIFQKIGRGIVGLFVRAGLTTVKFIAAILLGVVKGLSFLLSELLEMVQSVGRVGLWLWREITDSFRSRVKVSNELTRNIRRAKKEGKRQYIEAILQFVGSFFFGEGGVFYTAFNYILPIVSAAFLIGVVKLGSGLEYGLAVEFNGKEVGIISAEADFEEAEREVQQRISYLEDDQSIDLSAKFSLKIVADTDRYLSAGQLADEMLAASDQELTEAYGIYIDGNFIGAVKDKNKVDDALTDRLLNYHVEGIVKDVSYVNKIEYTQGIYLTQSVKSEDETIALLTSSKEKKAVYVVQSGDTPVTISQKHNMDLEKFEELNPGAMKKCEAGQIVNVIETDSYLPIQYVREMEALSFIDYETTEVETAALNLGIESILTKGERGEKVSQVEITYVNGIEHSRKVISTKVTREPVMEIIGLGTYTAQPDSPDTVWFGSPLTGSGQFGWPVDGGWISDTFISDRNHKGLDIAADLGTNIYAAEEGMVVSAGWNSGGYGNVVMIDHMNGYQTVYGHMTSVVAVEGQYVTKGELIGMVGSTGNSTGPHCHFEVRYEGVCKDPASYLNTQPVEVKKKDDDE
ncbi:MAG TPA: peptidoglycan DD-metalloendopeptidase family protein [Ruminococcus sp.]|nr:peptidoglycan DD-metalloendopeptidase family protein [Ruminococcus sp.]